MPPAVVTVTSTAPALPAGSVTVIVLPVSPVIVPSAVPNFTVAVAIVPRFAPLIWTSVPLASGPDAGRIPETLGAAMYVNASGKVTLPPAVVTVTSTRPGVPAGVVTTILVAVSLVTLPAAAPNLTATLELSRFAPVIVSEVPPAAGPCKRLVPVTTGA